MHPVGVYAVGYLIQRSMVTGPRPFGEHTFRLHLMLVRLGADAEAIGIRPVIARPGSGSAMPGLPALLTAAGVEVSEQTALAGLACWHLLDGALYNELLQLAGSELLDPDAYYEAMVSAIACMSSRSRWASSRVASARSRSWSICGLEYMDRL